MEKKGADVCNTTNAILNPQHIIPDIPARILCADVISLPHTDSEFEFSFYATNCR